MMAEYQFLNPGDRISASAFNRAMADLKRVMEQFNSSERFGFKMRVVRMNEIALPGSPSSLAEDRASTVQVYDQNQDRFIDGHDTKRIYDQPFDLPIDEDELIVVFYHEQSGKYIPVMGPRTKRHVKTVVDFDGNYPQREQHPDTYPFKFVRLEYRERGGKQGHTVEYISPEDGPDSFVQNLAESEEISNVESSSESQSSVSSSSVSETNLCNARHDFFIPLGTTLPAYNVNGQWFCDYSRIDYTEFEEVSLVASSPGPYIDESTCQLKWCEVTLKFPKHLGIAACMYCEESSSSSSI